MNQLSLRKKSTAPDQTPEPVDARQVEPEKQPDPAPSTPPVIDPQESPAPGLPFEEPEEISPLVTFRARLQRWLQQNKVLLGFVIVFLIFWNLADWTSATGSRMRPGQYIYSNEMAQLYTATYRLVFIIIMAALILKFTVPTLVRYWRRDVDPAFDASRDFLYHLTPHQRLWFSFVLLFALCYLFIQLLGVRLPESPSVGL